MTLEAPAPVGSPHSPEPLAAPARRHPDAPTVVATLAVWTPMLFWFAAFRPGLMSADSLAHWAEATRGGWTDLHPPAYTALMWISAELTGSPSALTLAQSLFLAAGIVAVAKSLLRVGAPPILTVAVTGVVAVSPMVGAFAVSMWKDVPYTACLLFVGARLLDVLAAHRRHDDDAARRALLACGAWLAPAVVLRQNGLLFALALLATTFAGVRQCRRLAAALALALVVLVASTKLVVFPALGVEPSPAFATLATFSHDLAAVATTAPESFDAEERALLARVAAFERWRTAYPLFGCTSLNWLYEPGFAWEGFEGRQRRYLALWLETLAEEPHRVVANRLCVASVSWRPDPVGTLYTVSRGIDPNDLGLRTVPVSHHANALGRRLLDASNDSSVQWFLWRSPPWTYLAYVAVGVTAWRRKEPALLIAAIPLAAQQLSTIPLNPAQDARYMMFSLIFAVMVLPLAAVRPPLQTGRPAHLRRARRP